MIARIILWLCILGSTCRAESLSVLIVDPNDSDAGRAIASAAAAILPEVRVQRTGLLALEQTDLPASNVVVWLDPQPQLYVDRLGAIWKTITADPQRGLLAIGVPADAKGRQALVESFAGRGNMSFAAPIARHLDGAFWIWEPGKKNDNQTVYLRKDFDVPSPAPARTWVQLVVDNRATVYLNGQRLGATEDWKTPASYDVTTIVKPGHNALAVEAFNADGPAGLLLSLTGWDAGGKVLLDVKSDKTWKVSTTKPAANWTQVVFDASAFQPAKPIAGKGEGEWEDKVRDDYAIDEYPLRLVEPRQPMTASLPPDLGRAAFMNPLVPGASALPILAGGNMTAGVASAGSGGRLVYLAIDVDKTKTTGQLPSVADSPAFANFINHCILYLAGRDPSAAPPYQPPPAPAPSKLQITGGRWVFAAGETFEVTDGKSKAAVNTKGVAPGTHYATVGSDRIRFDIVAPKPPDRFPAVMQFGNIPHEGTLPATQLPDDVPSLRRIIDNMIDHGCTSLYVPTPLPADKARDIESYAQSRGLTICYYFERPFEAFARKDPPEIPIHSSRYAPSIARKLEPALSGLKNFPLMDRVFAYQDEPFHAGLDSFDNSEEEKVAFSRAYGYDLRLDALSIRDDAQLWQHLLTFRSDTFADGWRQMYPILKRTFPNVQFVLNHDSHNTFGGAVGQEGKYAVDDVIHWRGDWADSLSFDIYPYLMLDFRYGPNRELKLPRMAQTHYAFAQMRNVCQTNNKPLGFWVGTYNPEWYSLTPEGKKQYWMEREMSYTAVAAGSDYLITGIGLPTDQRHWEDFGSSLRTLQKAGPALLQSKPPRARAAMIYPRTQTLLLQEEYWNVAQSYEAFLRAFGELDILHEEQITPKTMAEYPIIVLWDVKLLPSDVQDKLVAYVQGGGTIIADCVPQLDELRRPTDTMLKLFGVKDAQTGRLLWPIQKLVKKRPQITYGTMPAVAASQPSDEIAFQNTTALPVVSPRRCTPAGADVLKKMASGVPAITANRIGEGVAYLLGFCLQDTSFEAWRSGNLAARQSLNDVLTSIPERAGIFPHVRSSNPDIEAAVRVTGNDSYVFVIGHEPATPETRVFVHDLPSDPRHVVDVETGREIPLHDWHFDTSAGTGVTHLFRLTR